MRCRRGPRDPRLLLPEARSALRDRALSGMPIRPRPRCDSRRPRVHSGGCRHGVDASSSRRSPGGPMKVESVTRDRYGRIANHFFRCENCASPCALYLNPRRPRPHRFCSRSCADISRRGRSEAICHPGRPAVAKGLCKGCYSTKRYHEKPEHMRSLAAAFRKANPEVVRQRHNEAVSRRHGLTAKEYEEKLAGQGGRCAICGSPDSGMTNRRFAIDHDHSTNKNRDILCLKCNAGIGCLKDDPKLLRKAADYIERHRCTSQDS